MDELERKNLRAMIERHKECGRRWCKVAKQYWHDNVSVETATAVANQHALLTRECEFVTAAEQVGVNLPALLADSERLAELREKYQADADTPCNDACRMSTTLGDAQVECPGCETYDANREAHERILGNTNNQQEEPEDYESEP